MPFDTNPLDAAVRSWVVAHLTPAGIEVAAFISRIGTGSTMRWIASLTAVFLFAKGRGRAMISVAISPWLAYAAYSGIRWVHPRTRPPGAAGYHEVENSFPSAHASTAAAVCFTLAYILWRERMLNGRAAIAIAVLPPLVIGLSRVYLDVHWMTDVVGGWLVGLAVAAIAGGIYRLWPASAQ